MCCVKIKVNCQWSRRYKSVNPKPLYLSPLPRDADPPKYHFALCQLPSSIRAPRPPSDTRSSGYAPGGRAYPWVRCAVHRPWRSTENTGLRYWSIFCGSSIGAKARYSKSWTDCFLRERVLWNAECEECSILSILEFCFEPHAVFDV
jgi:hypothetical protein